jgi:DNA polymerase (family 10)
MPIHNSEIASIFAEVADLLDVKGENPFRIRAYRNAARTVGQLGHELADMLEQGENPSSLPGIGKDLAGKIRTIVETGSLPQLEELHKELKGDIVPMMQLPGVGPKRVKALRDALGVESLDDLRKAAEKEKIRSVPGFGEKTEQEIKEALSRAVGRKQRTKLVEAEQFVGPMLETLRAVRGVGEVHIAGSFRRRLETVGDLDILVTCDDGRRAADAFTGHEDVKKVLAKGETRSSVILRNGLHVDLRVVPDESIGAALHYFTGSKAHNIAIRQRGVKRGLKINEYGIFKGDKRVGGRTEEEVFDAVGLPYIPPELREAAGEIEAAHKHRLPSLLDRRSIRGDLHTHSTYTDGRSSIEEMARAARKLGYEYVAMCDHSKRITVAHGLDPKRLGRQAKEIDALNRRLKDITILKGCEVDILEDGSLDLPDDTLAKLDITVCSIHSKFKLSRARQTERVIKAMHNPHFVILAHPSGRLINEREPYDIDLEHVIKTAGTLNKIVELNAHPDRLDLAAPYCRLAREEGTMVAISTDSHSSADLDFMRFGVGQARRGWLEARNVINTRHLEELRKIVDRARS